MNSRQYQVFICTLFTKTLDLKSKQVIMYPQWHYFFKNWKKLYERIIFFTNERSSKCHNPPTTLFFGNIESCHIV